MFAVAACPYCGTSLGTVARTAAHLGSGTGCPDRPPKPVPTERVPPPQLEAAGGRDAGAPGLELVPRLRELLSR